MDVIRLALFNGSRAKDGDEPSLELCMVIWNFSSKCGWTSSDPKSINSSCHIFVLILAGTRASTGKFTEVKTSFGFAAPDNIPPSPAKVEPTARTASSTTGTSTGPLPEFDVPFSWVTLVGMECWDPAVAIRGCNCLVTSAVTRATSWSKNAGETFPSAPSLPEPGGTTGGTTAPLPEGPCSALS